jgi:hypothetical protein
MNVALITSLTGQQKRDQLTRTLPTIGIFCYILPPELFAAFDNCAVRRTIVYYCAYTIAGNVRH